MAIFSILRTLPHHCCRLHLCLSAFVSLPLENGFLGIAALAVAYKYVFDAGWVQAAVIGIVGGIIALVLFVILAAAVLTPIGLLD